MLLSNLSKLEKVSYQLLKLTLDVPKAEGEEGTDSIYALDLLLEIFLKGEGKKYNKSANYDFLASVFANVSTVSGPTLPLRGPLRPERVALCQSRPRLTSIRNMAADSSRSAVPARFG